MVLQKFCEERNSDNSLTYGQWLASPAEDEEVVISGIAGSYPNSKNVYELRDNLFNNIDMVSNDDQCFKLSPNPNIPKRIGRLKDIKKFDVGYFGIHENETHTMEVTARLFLEKAIEAILDAGINPKALEGTRTGVFVGVSYTENSKNSLIIGHMKNMIANRLSFHLKLKGPSFVIDTACSTSLYVLEHAYKALRENQCDSAIVGGLHLCLIPEVTFKFALLGVLSPDGKCKVFDNSANGYVRAEAIIALFLQKSKNSRRIYAQIVHTKGNCDGYKEEGIIYPSSAMQATLLKEIYSECQVNPNDLNYFEAHGTGTKVGDPVELFSIDEILGKHRTTPLLIGSVKSNLGHAETASGLVSITKTIIIFETGLIPPNLNYKTPRSGIEAIKDGRLKVVTEITPFHNNHELTGINSFALGGANCHIVLRKNTKEKIIGGHPNDNLPRLVCVSGRQEESITSILDDIKNRTLDYEYINLYHQIFCIDTINHLYRGYSIITKFGELKRSSKLYIVNNKPLYLLFNSFNNNCWKKIAEDLFSLPLFLNSIRKVNDILIKFRVNIMDILQNNKTSNFYQILGSMAIQIAIVDLVKILKIVPNGYLGYGFGEFICGYADNCLSLNETVLIIYEIAYNLQKFNKKFVQIDRFWIEYQSHLPELKKKLGTILKEPKIGLLKWITTIMLKKCLTAHFFQNLSSLKNSFNEQIKENGIIWEVGDLELLVNDFESNSFLKINKKNNRNYLIGFLELLGSLYEMGHNFKLDKLYPTVYYPVSRGTPMISPLIKWNHKHDWCTLSSRSKICMRGDLIIPFALEDEMWQFMAGHNINGYNLFPASGYLNLAWKGFSAIKGIVDTEMQIVIENCQFLRVTNLIKNSKTTFYVSLQEGSKTFKIHEGANIVTTGRILMPQNFSNDQINLPVFEDFKNPTDLNLTSEDIYKELRVRGYNFSGAFKKIVSCNSSITKAHIQWEGNWISFMDCMLQLKVLYVKSRHLHVPICIKYCSVDIKKHLAFVESFSEKSPKLPVYIYKDLDIIKCGGIEFRGIDIVPLAKRKSKNEAILETYSFVPNQSRLCLKTLLRVNTQLILENTQCLKFKLVELFNGANDLELFSPIINEAVNDINLVQISITILTHKSLNYPKFVIENKSILTQNDCDLIIGQNIIQNSLIFHQVLGALKENGFILSRQELDFQFNSLQINSIECLTKFQTNNESIFLLRRKTEFGSPISIKINNNALDWIQKLQESIKNASNKIIIYAQNEPVSGILGLINCIRYELGGDRVKCVFIQDQAPPFDPNNDFYRKQLNKNLVVNIYQNSAWGTYRHLLLREFEDHERKHIYVLNKHLQECLSGLKYMEDPLRHKTILQNNEELIRVHYSSLFFEDTDTILKNHKQQNSGKYFEFSGCISGGNRYMGLIMNGNHSIHVTADKNLIWKVPVNWSLEEAATVPAAYLIVLYSFFCRYKLKTRQTILIHSGLTPVGQAAIHVALVLRCTVYTTIETKEQKTYIKKMFPQLSDENIGSSSDISFEQLILNRTNGRGIDVVLNCLADNNKLLASVRCLTEGGTFLQIGTLNFVDNNRLKLILLKKTAFIYGIVFDKFIEEDPCNKQKISNIFRKALCSGFIKPLKGTIFKIDELESACQCITNDEWVGKVLIEIRKKGENPKTILSNSLLKKVQLQYHCDPEFSYVIVGGLGGFGLELADWLILKGARHLILSSRKGLSYSYQSFRIKIWESYGCIVSISTANISTKQGCKQLIEEAIQLAPVAGIFNLAVELKDALFENQNTENFLTVFKSKAIATSFLDEISQKLCPKLKTFVVFSSAVSGRGNMGQTNYAMANSIMERICEKRCNEGLPAIAIQWGPIGEIGILAGMQNSNIDFFKRGILLQGITNCLDVLNILLVQKCPIVSSIVIAEKRTLNLLDNIVDTVAHILGIRSMKTISLHSTLAELGMDSMTIVEIKQILEKEFKVFFTLSDIRNLTFAKLFEIQKKG